MAYELIETITLTSSASSIEFTSVPQDGVSLVLVASVRYDNNSSHGEITINGTTTNYNSLRLQGNGSVVSSANFPLNDLPYFLGVGNNSGATANTFGNTQVLFSNYTSSENKSVSIDGVTENNATEAFQRIYAGVWQNTSAITSIMWASSGNIVAGSTASLYKIS